MAYLVTGGTGFIGSHLVDELLAGGEEVVIISNKSDKTINDNLSTVSADIVDIDQVRSVFTNYNIDGVFHLAAMGVAPASFSNPRQFHDVNITGTANILIAAHEAGIDRLVFASSSLVYGKSSSPVLSEDTPFNPLTPYAVSKIAGEMYCNMFSEQYGLKISVLRYFNVYGPRQDPDAEFAAAIPKFTDMILHKKSPIIFGDGEQSRDFVYVKDIVQANLLAMQRGISGIFNIGSGSQTSLNQLIKMIKEISGVDVDVTYKDARAGDVRSVIADISKSKHVLGYSPKYSIYEGLKETVCYFQNI
ncbi:MAG: GDP-mannose 4,6-dehydratase [Acholeplasmataceae bacterium]|nr:GDP-mannose 4,6-dehydratase [Acholeplasmataceae bacterium]